MHAPTLLFQYYSLLISKLTLLTDFPHVKPYFKETYGTFLVLLNV